MGLDKPIVVVVDPLSLIVVSYSCVGVGVVVYIKSTFSGKLWIRAVNQDKHQDGYRDR